MRSLIRAYHILASYALSQMQPDRKQHRKQTCNGRAVTSQSSLCSYDRCSGDCTRERGHVYQNYSTTMSTESSKRTVAAANFNDDLTCYIESEKAQLTQMLTTQETVTREIVSNIKNRYEHELSNARKMYDEMARKYAKLEIDVEDFKSKLEKKTKDLEIAERNGMIYETRCNDLQLQFDQSQAEKKKAMIIIERKNKNLELASSTLDWTRAEVIKHIRRIASRDISSGYNLQHHAQFERQNLRDDLQKYCREQLAVLACKLNEEIQKQFEKLIFQEIKVSE